MARQFTLTVATAATKIARKSIEHNGKMHQRQFENFQLMVQVYDTTYQLPRNLNYGSKTNYHYFNIHVDC